MVGCAHLANFAKGSVAGLYFVADDFSYVADVQFTLDTDVRPDTSQGVEWSVSNVVVNPATGSLSGPLDGVNVAMVLGDVTVPPFRQAGIVSDAFDFWCRIENEITDTNFVQIATSGDLVSQPNARLRLITRFDARLIDVGDVTFEGSDYAVLSVARSGERDMTIGLQRKLGNG